jgi:hypothetical protein
VADSNRHASRNDYLAESGSRTADVGSTSLTGAPDLIADQSLADRQRISLNHQTFDHCVKSRMICASSAGWSGGMSV